jgi:DNA repair protein RadC
VIAATLSGAHEILNILLVTPGPVNQNQIYPREVFAEAVIDSVTAVIFIFNHPLGNLSPSTSDILITQKM